MFFAPYRRLPAVWGRLSGAEKLRAILWTPIIRISGDVAKMIGYPAGLRWRIQRLPRQPELRWQRHKNG
jgi:hypothetical protein